MKIDCWFKVSNGYKFLVLDISEFANDKIFYEKLKLKLIVENENIRKDIENIFDKYPNKVFSLSRPSCEDKDDNIKLKKLANARNANIETIAKLNSLMQYDEYIVCDKCHSIMYRTPMNVGFIKVGNKFMVDEDENLSLVKYDYICSHPNCNNMEEEDCVIFKQKNAKRRQELFEAGERWVPCDLGYYHNASDKEYNEWKEKNFF